MKRYGFFLNFGVIRRSPPDPVEPPAKPKPEMTGSDSWDDYREIEPTPARPPDVTPLANAKDMYIGLVYRDGGRTWRINRPAVRAALAGDFGVIFTRAVFEHEMRGRYVMGWELFTRDNEKVMDGTLEGGPIYLPVGSNFELSATVNFDRLDTEVGRAVRAVFLKSVGVWP